MERMRRSKRWRLMTWPAVALAVGWWAIASTGCGQGPRATTPRPPGEGEALLKQAVEEFHNRSADARGAEKERLLREAAARYERILKEWPGDEALAIQARSGLASVCALRGDLLGAVKHYAVIGEKYPHRSWEVLQAWKAAADLLWDANQRGEPRLNVVCMTFGPTATAG